MNSLSQKVTDFGGDVRESLARSFRTVGFASTAQYLNNNHHEQEEEDMNNETILLDHNGDEENRLVTQFLNDKLVEYMQEFRPEARQANSGNNSANKYYHQRISTTFKAVAGRRKEDDEAAAASSSPSLRIYSLDQVERRYNWIRNVTRKGKELHQQESSPKHLHMYLSFTRNFLLLTRRHLLELLRHGPEKDKDAENATVLLKAMRATIRFEKEMIKWLQQEYDSTFETNSNNHHHNNNNRMPSATQTSTDDVKLFAILRKQRALVKEQLAGLASTAFDKYMTPYIAIEEVNMNEQLMEAASDNEVDTRLQYPVFISSKNMFLFIKGSMIRCEALTNGYVFYTLYQSFQKSLLKYAQILDGKLPSPILHNNSLNPLAQVSGASSSSSSSSSSQSPSPSSSSYCCYKLTLGEEVTVCDVLSTCEYCTENIEGLEELIRDKIDEKYKSKIHMIPETEAYHDLLAKSIQILVSGLQNRIEASLKLMSTTTSWGTYDEVREESSYVRLIHQEVVPFVTTVRGAVSIPYFRSFCDKFVTVFTSAYYDTLVRLKRINEPGAQQLLLDVYSLKTLFLKFPTLKDENLVSQTTLTAVVASSSVDQYTNMVQKQFHRIETLLKLIGTPANLLVDVYREQRAVSSNSGSSPSSLDELHTVMALKGLKRKEQAAILQQTAIDKKINNSGMTSTGAHPRATVIDPVFLSTDIMNGVNNQSDVMRQKADAFKRRFQSIVIK